jgi:hypothetical protein
MRALSAPELLDVWERGRAQGPVQRALTVLGAACPDVSPEALAQLAIGQRDGRLLTLREWAFGSQMTGLSICPNCGQRLELAFDVADVRMVSEPASAPSGTELLLTNEGYEVRFRLPNSLDLQAVSGCEDATEARQRLLQRCILAVHSNGDGWATGDLPAEVLEELMARMAEADPQADVQVALSCPACEHEWLAMLDIPSFFWTEIEAWTHRTLGQVHALASAYGWREADILAMSPWRRERYLEMVGNRA